MKAEEEFQYNENSNEYLIKLKRRKYKWLLLLLLLLLPLFLLIRMKKDVVFKTVDNINQNALPEAEVKFYYIDRNLVNLKTFSFFTKDTVNWAQADFSPFYKTLNALKHANEALWNAPYGGTFEQIKNTEPAKVLSFIREKGKSKVVVIANLSNEKVTVNLKGSKADGDYKDVFTNTDFTLYSSNLNLTLQPWGYWVMEKK